MSGVVFIGVTLACSPVPEPPLIGKGNDTSYVTIVTDAKYDPSKFNEYMGYWPQTKIEEYSKRLGDLVDLKGTNVGGQFAFTFTLLHSDCEKVKMWMAVIVPSSPHYVAAPVTCVKGVQGGQQITTIPPIQTTVAPTVSRPAVTGNAQPVPRPAVTGKGNEDLTITFNTRFIFDGKDVAAYWNYWTGTKIDEYAGLLGDRQYISLTDNGGNLSFSMVLANSDCNKVSSWLRQIVTSSTTFKNAYIDGAQCRRLITP